MFYKSIIVLLILLILLCSCQQEEQISNVVYNNEARLESIPVDVIKGTPLNDQNPPILHSDEFEKPIPLPIISTKGAEDSPFIPYNSNELYFFFVNDVKDDPSIQIRNILNGIWVSKYKNNKWQQPTLVVLQDKDQLALNGAQFINDNKMLFATAREGYTGIHWFSAEYINDKWSSWELFEFEEDYMVGELHIFQNELYYHSPKEGGYGGNDIWMLTFIDEKWQNPINITILNSSENEGMPYISKDGLELWFNRTYKGTPALYRSIRINGEWEQPELMISQFAGEPTLDQFGNLYFVHHYYRDGEMIEADIYVAYKK